MYILLGNYHLGNIFAKVMTRKILFVIAKPLAIVDCWDEIQGSGTS